MSHNLLLYLPAIIKRKINLNYGISRNQIGKTVLLRNNNRKDQIFCVIGEGFKIELSNIGLISNIVSKTELFENIEN